MRRALLIGPLAGALFCAAGGTATAQQPGTIPQSTSPTSTVG